MNGEDVTGHSLTLIGPSGEDETMGQLVYGDVIRYYPMVLEDSLFSQSANRALQFRDPDNPTQTVEYIDRTLSWNGTWLPATVMESTLCM